MWEGMVFSYEQKKIQNLLKNFRGCLTQDLELDRVAKACNPALARLRQEVHTFLGKCHGILIQNGDVVEHPWVLSWV